jgi:SAM-dependent methyltransferase
MLYDTIGRGYATRRQTEPRIVAMLQAVLQGVDSIANIGAGTGSYELADRTVVAIEPSMAMLRQRAPGTAPAIQASAEHLPLKDGAVAAATAILTVHHWSDRAQGLRELARVARELVVILTWDPEGPAFWLTEEYFPAIVEKDLRNFPRMAELVRILGPVTSHVVPVPHDCIDGFLGAYWRRPQAYLDPAVRAGMSGFANLPGLDAGLLRLEHDLRSGEWERRYAALLERDSLDIGYRLVVARPH